MTDLLTHLRERNIKLWVEEDRLRFRAPKGAMTAELQAQIATHKAALIAFLREAQHPADEDNAIPVAPRTAALPLALTQERVWFLDQLQAGTNTAFNMSAVLRLDGPLNVPALECGLSALIARHESLRTNFVLVDGVPQQVIAPAVPFVLPLVELSPQTHQHDLHALADAEDAHRFDLAHDLLLRATLLRASAHSHVLLLTMHHIISDGWSLKIMVEELAALYWAFVNGQPSPLPALEIQYADYAVWQRERLQGERLQAELDYWKQALADAPQLLAMPTYQPRPAVQRFNGARLAFTVDGALTRQLRELSQRTNTTLSMLLLAAYQVLLARYTGQHDLVVGQYAANRTHKQVEPLIGFFVNTLLMRADVSDNPTVSDFLARVRQTSLNAYTHQEMPFARLAEELRPTRDLSYTPLYQASYVFQGQDSSSWTMANLQVTLDEPEVNNLNDDLALELAEVGETLRGALDYNTDLYKPEFVANMAAHFEMLLRGMAANPSQRVLDLPMLTEREVNAQLAAWAKTHTVTDSAEIELPFIRQFEAQVERTPHALAVQQDATHLTYAQLNARANTWAQALITHGVQADGLVMPYFERSIDFLTAILAIFKAGGAYLPVDPRIPTARLSQILAQSRTPLVITNQAHQQRLQDSLQGLAAAPAVLLIEALDEGTPMHENPPPRSTANGLAYVIYTSGSTGEPKGVMVEQRGMVNHLHAKRRDLQMTERDVIGQTATQSWVISVWQFLAALITGARVQIVADDKMLDTHDLLNEVARHQISVVEIVPSVMRLLVESLPQHPGGLPACVRWLVPTGEALPPALVRAWFAICPHVPLLNAYGSSETSDDVAHDVITAPPADDVLNMPLGAPIPNVQLLVLDHNQRPVPAGVAGELYVGGAAVGRGYLFDEALTAQKFISSVRIARNASSAPSDNMRLYKTGDRVRVLPNGRIEYLGRVDFQVKVRGIRIELGEIEAVLSAHPAIAQCVLVARADAHNATQLVAYVVAHPSLNDKPAINDLRSFVAQRLPDYMVPAIIVLLDKMPLNNSGKLDRKALPAPDFGAVQTETYVSPRTETETVLADIWRETLTLNEVSVTASFFDLGGHSLLATQVASRIRQRLSIDVPLRVLFEQPTIEALARQLDTTAFRAARPPIQKAERGETVPMSYAQQRLWLIDQLEDGGGYVIPAALKLDGFLDVPRLQASLSALVARHESLRTTFESVDGQPVQRIQAPAPVALPVEDLRHLPTAEREAEAQRRAHAMLQQKFDLVQGPLLRCTLYQIADHAHLLYVLMHHIITDGWSIPIMAGEVMQHYANPDTPRPELALQYADYAQWQRAWLQGDVLQSQLSYWTKQLSDAPPLIELPTDRPRTNTPSFKADSVDFVIEADLTRKLNALAQKNEATPYMLMVGAYALLLSRYSGQAEVVIGTPTANRPDQALDELIGFFVNTLALRLNLSSAGDSHDLLREVKRVTLDGYAHQDASFEQIVDALKLPRAMSHTPVFQVLFAWQNFTRPALQTDDIATAAGPLRIQDHDWKKTTIEYDLVLSMHPTDEATGEPSTLQGTWEFSTDLFDRATVQRMVLHFKNLLSQLADHADLPINTLPTLSDAEAHRLLAQPESAPFVPATVHGLFEVQAAQHPNAIALVFEDETMTYAELNAQASHVAQHLQAHGVGVGQRVAICAERSMEMVIAALAVMKAGAAYVPLDPDYPAERLQFMLDNAQVALVLTQYEWAHRFSAARVLVIEEIVLMSATSESQSIAQGAPSALSDTANATPNDPIYVIYTSGSTGQPKGVVVPHKGVANTVQNIARATSLGLGDRYLLFVPFAFDASALALYASLTSGATLVLHRNPTQLSINDLHTYCLKQRVSVLDFAAAFWQQWVETLSAQGVRLPAHLRVCLTGGDKISLQTLQAWAALADHEMTFLCSYGPTEASITTTTFVTTNHAVLRNPPAHIGLGAPLPNMAIYVLDAQGQLTPPGVPGELYIGGVGVAHGYWQQDGLTQQRFLGALPAVNAHLNGSSPKRFYRTGDLARWLPDGTCEFVGRVDTQVKIRGFRIELGEIETQIKKLPQVREAVVLALAFGEGDKRVVAYYQPSDASLTRDRIAQSDPIPPLRAVLPPHMLPSIWVPMNEWPLTPNGKLDRNALPKPELNDNAARYVAPRNALETELAQMWAEVLGIEINHVGVESDFFELGGHSLLAMQVVARIRQTHGIDFPLRSLMESPTVATMATVLSNLQHTLDRLRPNATNHTGTNTEHTEDKELEMELIEL